MASTRRLTTASARALLTMAGAFAALLVSVPAGAQQAVPAGAPVPAYVGMSTCLECHREQGQNSTLHFKAADSRTPAATRGCESCHGPGSLHANDPDTAVPMRFSSASAVDASAACTSCHASSSHAFWANSKHDARNVACGSCHSVHSPRGDSQLKETSQVKLCGSCHQNIVAKLTRFNHMPVREEQMVCTSCHNTHGSANVKMLRVGTTVNESCASCHTEKRGPYLWEHAPVANSCVTCHDPHGSSNDRMLVAKPPYLCQRCHVTSRHPPTIYDQYVRATSSGSNRITGRACVNCHQQLHGSNSPNGRAYLR